mmetsp:Transcript_61624/g.133412  ORF Transcript_61624/g.133412 Transcript_61624/m.133412 type:complete len:440 (+) Transcript_61624:82-1401(+)
MPRRRKGVGGEGANDNGDRSAWGAMFAKTKMCQSNIAGKCVRGQACAFAHGLDDLRPLPNLQLTKMCWAFSVSGICDKGDSCSFAHSLEEMRRAPSAPSASDSMQLLMPVMPQQDDPSPLEEPMPRDGGRLPGRLPSERSDGHGLASASPMDLGQGFGPAGSRNAKEAAASEESWCPLSLAQATQSRGSRQSHAIAHEGDSRWASPKSCPSRTCGGFPLSGFGANADSFSFVQSLDELRRSPATAPQLMSERDDRDEQERVSSDVVGRLPDRLAHTGTDSLNVASWCKDPKEASEFAKAQVEKMAMSSDEIWSRQTTAQAISLGWSRQTTLQEEDARDRWCRQMSESSELKASCEHDMRVLPRLQGSMGHLDRDRDIRIIDSYGDDASSEHSDDDLELQVHNTFLAAVPRSRSDRRACSVPVPGRFSARSTQMNKFVSY